MVSMKTVSDTKDHPKHIFIGPTIRLINLIIVIPCPLQLKLRIKTEAFIFNKPLREVFEDRFFDTMTIKMTKAPKKRN